MQRLEVSDAVRHTHTCVRVCVCVVRRKRVNKCFDRIPRFMPGYSKSFLHFWLSNQNLHAAVISPTHATPHIIVLNTTVLTMLCEQYKL
jgi:hypothetical protein